MLIAENLFIHLSANMENIQCKQMMEHGMMKHAIY